MLNCKYIIITSVKEIDEFYQNVFENEDEPISQLKRRCKTYIKMDKKSIEVYSYNKNTCDYELKSVSKNDNPYLEQKEDDNATSESIFKSMLDDSTKLKPENYDEIHHFPDISDVDFLELVEKVNEKEEEKTLSLKTPPEMEIYNLTFDEIQKKYKEVNE